MNMDNNHAPSSVDDGKSVYGSKRAIVLLKRPKCQNHGLSTEIVSSLTKIGRATKEEYPGPKSRYCCAEKVGSTKIKSLQHEFMSKYNYGYFPMSARSNFSVETTHVDTSSICYDRLNVASAQTSEFEAINPYLSAPPPCSGGPKILQPILLGVPPAATSATMRT